MRPAGGIGIRAGLRNRFFRVRIPGGAPDFVLRWRSRRALFYNLDVARSPAARIAPAFTRGPRGGAAGLVVPNNSPVAQWKRERAATNREAEGSNPSWGARRAARLLARRIRSSWRRNSEERVPACRAGGRGFKSRRCRQQQTARSSTAQSSRLLTGRLQVRLLPRRPLLLKLIW